MRVYWQDNTPIGIPAYWLRGNERSGHWGHTSVIGKRGGSAPGKGGDAVAALVVDDDPPIVTDRSSGGASAAHAAMLQTLKDKLPVVEEYGSTKFILPDGTRLGHDARTHAQAADQVGVDLWEAMRGGLLRREGYGGVEAGSPITDAQAQHILDGALMYAMGEVDVDIFFPDPAGVKNSLGRVREHRATKKFRTDISPDTLRAWVNGHYPHALSEREQAQWFLLYGNERSGNYGHAGRPGHVGGSAPGDGDADVVAQLDAPAIDAIAKRYTSSTIDARAISGASAEIIHGNLKPPSPETIAAHEAWAKEYREEAWAEYHETKTEPPWIVDPDNPKSVVQMTEAEWLGVHERLIEGHIKDHDPRRAYNKAMEAAPLIEAIRQAPEATMPLYRAVGISKGDFNAKKLDNLKPGDPVSMDRITSFSESQDGAAQFAATPASVAGRVFDPRGEGDFEDYELGGYVNYQFIIEGEHKSLSVSEFSRYSMAEKERLTHGKFEVVKVEEASEYESQHPVAGKVVVPYKRTITLRQVATY